MKIAELKSLIKEELFKAISEKSVPQPYDRNNARPMSAAQIKRRDKIGNAILASPEHTKYFKKIFKDEWEDYLWATATNKALKGE